MVPAVTSSVGSPFSHRNGLAQVRGLRGETDTEDKLIWRLESDLEYIENWSLWQDVLILARTLFSAARMTNAY